MSVARRQGYPSQNNGLRRIRSQGVVLWQLSRSDMLCKRQRYTGGFGHRVIPSLSKQVHGNRELANGAIDYQGDKEIVPRISCSMRDDWK
jgi:hypothetical protein